MLESEFRSALTDVLRQHADGVRERLRRVVAALPDAAEGLELMVLPEQDGEGPFDVQAMVSGPGLHGLNKALGEDARLFGVVHTADGVEPPVPFVDSFSTPFSVNDVVVDCVATWLTAIWQSLGPQAVAIPVTIQGDDNYGTITPVTLVSV